MTNKSSKLYLLLSLLAISSATFGDTWTISGKVMSKELWEPIPNAKVSFIYENNGGEISVNTDSKGNYSLQPDVSKKR